MTDLEKILVQCQQCQKYIEVLLDEINEEEENIEASIDNEKRCLKILTPETVWLCFKDISPLLMLFGIHTWALEPGRLFTFNQFINTHWFLPFELTTELLIFVEIVCFFVVSGQAKTTLSSYTDIKQKYQANLNAYQLEKQNIALSKKVLEQCLYKYQQEEKEIAGKIRLQSEMPSSKSKKLSQKEQLNQIKQEIESAKDENIKTEEKPKIYQKK